MKIVRAKRQIENVGDNRNENNSTGFKKPTRNRIRITLFVKTAEEGFGDFSFRGRLNRKVWRC